MDGKLFFEGGAAMYTMAKKPKACDTVQCVRKRVSGNGARIEGSDLFYDKSDGRYYNHMREIRYCRDCQIYPDEYHMYLRSVPKDRSAHTVILAELADKTAYIKLPVPQEPALSGRESAVMASHSGFARGTPGYSGMLVSAGIEEIAPPPMVRLYSEAEMMHASTLAGKMTNAAHYNAFRGIGGTGLLDVGYGGAQAPLIKATEFDDREQVMARYSSKKQYDSVPAIKQILREAKAKEQADAQTETIPKEENDRLVDKAKRAVRDAFARGRRLAARHNHRYADINHIFGNADGSLGKAIDDIIKEVLDTGSQEREVVMPEDESARVKIEINAEIAGILGCVPEFSNIVKEKIARQFKNGYVAVSSGWAAQGARLAERESYPSLEVSYGGSTGDMTSAHMPHKAQRRYDIIQSTFFWMPGLGSLANAKAILRFFDVHSQKLNPGGIIRFVGFSDNGEELITGWEGEENQYEKAADWVCERLRRRTYYTDVKRILLTERRRKENKMVTEGIPYDEELSRRKLNSREDSLKYRPLWTDANRAVGGGGDKNSNLILQARKRRVFRP